MPSMPRIRRPARPLRPPISSSARSAATRSIRTAPTGSPAVSWRRQPWVPRGATSRTTTPCRHWSRGSASRGPASSRRRADAHRPITRTNIMSDPFTGEIQIYAFTFAPYNWAMCAGQLMPIQQNTALFSLLGTTFGGNGTSNYQLPNFIGNTACGQGAGSGLTPRTMGETFGSDSVGLLYNQMPTHNHGATIYNQPTQANRTGIPATGDAVITPENVQI